MGRSPALHVAVFMLLLPAVSVAQSRPDLSGRWTSEPEAAAPGAGRVGAAPGGTAGAGGAGPGRAGAAGPGRAGTAGAGGSVGGSGPARGGAPNAGSGLGPTITLRQETATLLLEYPFFGRGDMQPALRYTYALDGTETINRIMMGRGIQEQRSRATWNGAALVLTNHHLIPDPAGGRDSLRVEVTHRLSLESPTSMIVETTRAGILGAAAVTTRTVYRKLP